jgi:hypothetical protein
MFELFVESGCFSAPQTLCSTEAFFQNSLRRSHLSPPAFANNDAKHFPNIFFRLEKFLSFALANDTADESPTDQVAQIAVGISTADLELLHDVVGAKRCWRGNEKSVDLSHGAIDPPGAPDNPPLTYKLVSRFTQSCADVVSIVHVVSVNTEITVSQVNSQVSFEHQFGGLQSDSSGASYRPNRKVSDGSAMVCPTDKHVKHLVIASARWSGTNPIPQTV